MDRETENLWSPSNGNIFGPKKWPAERKRNHPASKPGTGRKVMWGDEGNEIHVVSPYMRCVCCGWYQDSFYGGECACGANNWINLRPREPSAPAAPSRLRALGDPDSPRLHVDQYPGSAVATVLEGIGRGMTILLVGTAGVGKSTLAAQAGFTVARQLGATSPSCSAAPASWPPSISSAGRGPVARLHARPRPSPRRR